MRTPTPIAALIAALLALSGSVAAQAPSLTERRQRLVLARQQAAVADASAARLLAAAGRERDAAGRAAARERALAARVAASLAELATAEVRAGLVDRLLADQRARLAAAQAPVARLLAGLESLAGRPAIVAAAQPGSVDDLVHLRAVLGGALPVVRARTAGVRAELAATRRLRADAALAAQALRDGRARLDRDRRSLAAVEARHRGRASMLRHDALSEGDRALVLGEQARDLVDQLAEQGSGVAVAAELAQLAGPLPRPLAPGAATGRPPHDVYRLPVEGRLVTGFGEVSDAGVRSRGLTFAVAPAAPVVAPAGGRVRYAGRFRGYGGIVIIDHADGWSSLLTGLGTLATRVGAVVRAGAPMGSARRGEEPQITVELRRRGRPIDAAALIG